MKKWIIIFTLLPNLLLAPYNIPALAADLTNKIGSYEASSLIKSDGSFWVWGDNQPVPLQVYGLSDVEKSFDCQLVMKKDHTVWFWERMAPSGSVQTYDIKLLNNIIDVQSGWSDILTLDKEGKVSLLSTQGKLDPNQLNKITPLSDIDNVADISSYEEYHQERMELRWVFLKKDGTVWINKVNFPTEEFEPISSLNNIIDIEENIALKQDGTVWSWPNETGNESVQSLTATPISKLTNIRSIKAYDKSNVAIDQNSCLWFWGVTLTGYSDGTIQHYQSVPVKLTSISDVKEAFVVERSLIVLTSAGDVYLTSIDREKMPENPTFNHLTSNVQQIKAGSRHIIMQKKDGTLWGWGVNKNGQLGCGDFEFMYNIPQPVQKPVSVYLNGKSIVLNSGIIIRNSQAFIPLRSVFEKMGATITWDASNKTVTIDRTETGKPPVTISINYPSGKVYMNKEQVILSNTPFILVNTGYLPLRFISESLGAKVEWVKDEGKIVISM